MKKLISLLVVAIMSLSIVASCAAPKKSTTSESEDTFSWTNSSQQDSTPSSNTDTTPSTPSSQDTGTSDSSSTSSEEDSNTSSAIIEESATQEQMYGSKYAGAFNYEDYETLKTDENNKEYNRNLFYYNELKFEVADPSVIYVSKEQDPVDGGYFYAYGTSDQIWCNGLQAWRSADMTNWEDLGAVYVPNLTNNWAYTNFWAPECIYDPTGMVINGETYHYFMVYNAELWSTVPKGDNGMPKDSGTQYLSMLYAKSAAGPFYAPEGYVNANGETLDHTAPVFNFAEKGRVGARTWACIDGSPFIDTDGQKYMYYSGFSARDGQNGAQCIYGVKMKDWFSPDYSTLKMICEYGKKTPGGASISDIGGVNEGPFMYKVGNTYMMTFSTDGYQSVNYQVRLANGDSPLGTFTKLEPTAGGTVIKTLSTFEVRSAGHHCFIKVGDQLYIAYHTFKNRANVADGRALAIDEVHVVDYNGQKIFVTNGPTYSYQPLPAAVSGYKNVASEATITGSSLTNASALTDGLVKFQTSIGYDVPEASLAKNGTMTITFNNYKNVRAVMLYLPYEYYMRFAQAKVEIKYKSASGTDKTITINDWTYDADHHYLTGARQLKTPGGTAILEFNDLPVKSIKFTFTSLNSSSAKNVKLDEVVVLSSVTNTAINGVADAQVAQPYTYTNALVPPIVLHPQGEVIGSVNVDGTALYSTHGVDVSKDDGTTNLIKMALPHDQYAFFKGVSSKNAYLEAEINVFESVPYLGDKWPKIGIVAKNAKACTFLYIDAANNYTKKAIGYTQSKLGGGDWDWANTENLKDVGSIRYKQNDGWTKLAILRLGNDFWFYCNDKLIFMASGLRGMSSGDNAGYGFLSFNTGLQVRNYSITTNLTAINAKLEQLGSSFEEDQTQGDTITTFGSNSSVTSSAAWDLTKDYATGVAQYNERQVSLTTSDGADNYLYFKNVNSNNFYAEATFKATAVYNSEAFGKYGFAIFSKKSDTKTKTGIFYYVDAAGGYTGKNLNYATVKDDVFSWDRGATNANAASTGTITIGIYRQGTIVKLLKNGEVIFTATADLAGALYPCLYSFNIGLEVTNYRITASKTDPKMSELYVSDTDEGGYTAATFGTLENSLGNTQIGWTNSGLGTASNTTGGEARTLVTNLGGNRFYFEANFTFNSVLNNDGYPKGGIFLKTGGTETFFAIDALPGGKGGAAYFGGNDWMYCATRIYENGGVSNWSNEQFREAFGMQYTNGNVCTIGVYYDNGKVVFSVNKAPIFNLSGLGGVNGDAVVGLMTFNLNATVSNAKFTIDEDALANVKDELGLVNAAANIVVDGNISDWAGSYANTYTFWDDAGRGFEVMATMGTNGVYVAYHGIVDHINAAESSWWLNTNVEMVAYPKTTQEKLQVYVSIDGQQLRATVYAYTYKTRADERYDVYFELYIPYVNINYTGSEDSVVLCFALRPGNYNGVADVSSQGWDWWAGQYGAWDQSNAFTGYLVTKTGIVKP